MISLSRSQEDREGFIFSKNMIPVEPDGDCHQTYKDVSSLIMVGYEVGGGGCGTSFYFWKSTANKIK